MGFDIYASTVTFEMGDDRYKGAEITARLDLPIETMRVYEDAKTLADECAWFAEHALVDWNIEAKGEPVPATLDGLNTLPIAFRKRLIRAYTAAVYDVPGPLVTRSSGGEQPPAPEMLELASASTLLPS